MLRLPRDQFDSEWANSNMPAKCTGGTFHTEIVHEVAASNPAWVGGTSRIVKLMTANNQHIGTLHEIVLPDGTVPHSHPKDYTRRDCSRIRRELAVE